MDKAEKHFDQGRLLSMKGLYPEAIDAYKKALEIDPSHTQARTNLQFICYFSGIGIGEEDWIKNVAKTKNLRKGTWDRSPHKFPSLSTLENWKLSYDQGTG